MAYLLFLYFLFFPLLLWGQGEIHIGVMSQPESLFYPIANDQVSDLVTQLVVEPLVQLDPKTNKIVSVLAKKWDVKKDQVTLILNPLAHFSDNSLVTARDVFNTFQAFKQNKIPSPDFESQFSDLKNIQILKDNTIRFLFKHSSPDHLQRIAWLPILSSQTLLNIEKQKNFALSLSGSGPYVVESVESGNKISLVKNPLYWNAKNTLLNHQYQLDKIHIKIVPDFNAQIEMLKNGAIDYLPILSSKAWNKDLAGPLFESGKILKSQTLSKLPYQVSGIVWNLRLPLFQSLKTRTALAHLYPVQNFIKNFLYDSYLPSSGIFHPHSECHAFENKPKDFSPSKAIQLLEEDGWAKKEDGLLYKNGHPFKFNLIVRQAGSLRHLTVYQEELKKVGIEISLVSLDWVIALNKVRSHDFEASEYAMDRPLMHSELMSMWGTKGGLNYSGLSDSTVDSLLSKISAEFDEKKKKQLCQQLDKKVAELQPLTFGWEQVYLRVAYADKFETPSPPFYAYSTWRNAFHFWNGKNPVP